MDFNVIREYLTSDPAVSALVNSNVFLFERPEQVSCNDYILYSAKELDGGNRVRTYQLDVRAVSTDPLKVLDIKDAVISALDQFNRYGDIYNDECDILSCILVNGGGMARNDETGEYHAFLYFKIKL